MNRGKRLAIFKAPCLAEVFCIFFWTWHRLVTLLASWDTSGHPLTAPVTERCWAKSDALNEIVGCSLECCCFRFLGTEDLGP